MLVFMLFSITFFLYLGWTIIRETYHSFYSVIKKPYVLLPRERSNAIKGIAAIAILLMHLSTHSNGEQLASGVLNLYIAICKTLGILGVDLFFFISGYGNYFSIQKLKNEKDRLKWLFKRFAGVLVIYLTCFSLVSFILFILGYTSDKNKIIFNIFTLTMPGTTTWYIKIQLLMYLFMFMVSFLKDKRKQWVILLFLCLILSMALKLSGFREEWWMSNLCFAAGMGVAAYKSEIENLFRTYKSIFLIVFELMFPVLFYLGVIADTFIVKILGNTFLVLGMIAIFECIGFTSILFCRLGSYSLAFYLVHISINAWIMRERIFTNPKVFSVIIFTLVTVFISKYISDRFMQRVNTILS